MENKYWLEEYLTSNLIATLIVAVILLTVRFLTVRYIRASNHNWSSQQRLRWIGSSKTIFFILLVLGVVLIWGETIQGLAVSVFAIAFALVFSVKELCMCLNGSFMRFRGHLYDIGDRIEIKGKIEGIRGDVIEMSLLSTTILEVGKGAANHQFTGRRITFPNSLVIASAVINESFLGNYYMNNITIPLLADCDWKRAKGILLQIAQDECAPYIEQARRRMQHLEKRRSLELPSVEPRVTVQIPSREELHLHLRLPSPAHLKGRLEQVVITRFLEQFHEPSSQELPLNEK